ncbi:hypothetical protein [Pontibacter sp. CAU 1760]
MRQMTIWKGKITLHAKASESAMTFRGFFEITSADGKTYFFLSTSYTFRFSDLPFIVTDGHSVTSTMSFTVQGDWEV